MVDGSAVIRAHDLTVGFAGRTRFDAVRGVDLRLAPGEMLGVVGEAGAGKSSLARVLAGRPARRGERGPRVLGGDLQVLGLRAARPGRAATRVLSAQVGWLPQQAGRMLAPDLTVAENVTQPLFARDRRFDQREAGARAAELIDAVQLPLGMLAKYPWELSAGQRQRVAIARSLILQPALWIADEPTAGVDVLSRGQVLQTLLELHAERVFSAVIVSHDIAVMQRATDRLIVLHRGVIAAEGSVDEVFEAPEHPYVRGLAADYRTRTAMEAEVAEQAPALV